MDIPELEMFLRIKGLHVSFRVFNSCYLCTSHSTTSRYVPLMYKGDTYLLHRLLYKFLRDDFDESLVVRHLCNNSKCCNPKHLQIGTQKDNVKDMVNSNRLVTIFKGSSNPQAKLTVEAVRQIRKSRLSNKALANKHLVSVTTISHIRNYHTYKDIIP